MPALPVPLTVTPGPPLRGRFEPPGDKSITHRALILGALASGETHVTNLNPGEDCAATLACLEALGATARERSATGVTLAGTAGVMQEPARVLDCGNSGTTLRLLAGVLAPRPLLAVLAGDESLHRRPVDRVIEPLRRMGASLWARDDRLPPLIVRGGTLRALAHVLPVASAQVASCILLAGLGTPGTTIVDLPGPARDHTERMLGAFGVRVAEEPRAGGGRRVALTGPGSLAGAKVRVPGDVSAAAFFLAAAAATPGASVTAHGVGLNPTRTAFLDVLEAMGAGVSRQPLEGGEGEPAGHVTVTGPERLKGFAVPAEWLPRMIDEAPAWAVVAAVAEGTSRLSGAGELRVKESDRLATIAANLRALGIAVEEHPEGLAVRGGRVEGGAIRTHGDHRVAMAFAVLGTLARTPVTLDDSRAIQTSYPGFEDTLASLGGILDRPRSPTHA